jgi:hypothetical protein
MARQSRRTQRRPTTGEIVHEADASGQRHGRHDCMVWRSTMSARPNGVFRLSQKTRSRDVHQFRIKKIIIPSILRYYFYEWYRYSNYILVKLKA